MIGQTISHYRIVEKLGGGGMGVVYEADDLKLGRRVAIKFLLPNLAADAAALLRFEQEARAASALDHPSICTVYEVDEHEGKAFIVMQLLRGQTLRERIETREGRCPFAINELLAFAVEIAEGLQAAHQKGIIHRDIKPENIFITEQGHAKILDFGVAKLIERTEADGLTSQDAHDGETHSLGLTLSGKAVGTAAYMSPEQVRGEKLDGRTDLFSFGLVLYEMATGVRPFGDEIAGRDHSLNRAYPSLPQFNPLAPTRLAEIVKKALEKDRELRYQSADELAADLSRQSAALTQARTSRRTPILVAVIALCVAAGVMAWSARRNAKARWARHDALPEIVKLAGADKFDDAYRLAQQAEPYLAGDPLFAEQLRAILRRAIIESDPPGGEVFYRPYGRNEEPWRPLGKAPIDARVPRGLMHWKVEMAGREMAEDIGPGPFSDEFRQHFTLFSPSQVPPGMVRIASSDKRFHVIIPGLEHLSEVDLPDYWIDRHEVTNRAFKQFVDEGGYRRAELWQEPFVKDGRTLTFEAAIEHFRDTTGWPGPAVWEMGAYIDGQDDYPVGGVSWYEAAAFARWAGKSLPTIYHWIRAADPRLSADVVPASNADGKSLRAVGASGGITRGGTTDMAGNVKEWVLTTTGGKRYILGGAWNEAVYMFTAGETQSPFIRHPTYGFRCIKVDRPEDLGSALTAVVPAPSRDVRAVKPVSSAVFEAWRSLYSFDHGDLKVQAEFVDDTSPDWRMEKVSYDAAYGDERIPAYLFLPKNAKPPYQVMIGFSGSNVFYERSSATTTDFDRFNFIMRSGRAFLYPIYKSTFERADAIKDDIPDMTAAYRDHMIMWSKDVGRSVDYLESRSDVSKDRIGYIGLSTGAVFAPIFLAMEPRFSLGVIYMGGFLLQPSLPEADAVNFAPRVKMPVLMLNGRFDYFLPTASSQEPLFRSLGTPAEHKRRVVYEASHNIPRNEMIKEVVNWMEEYWGPPTPRY